MSAVDFRWVHALGSRAGSALGSALCAATLSLFVGACSKGEAATNASVDTSRLKAPWARAGCLDHAACGEHYVIDVAPVPACAAGSVCSVTLKLVAQGDFHVNDEYPYKFKANDAPGVSFEGTDASGRNVFSKPAGDWQKGDAKSGTMSVRFRPQGKGKKTIAGMFKLSVCSAASCEIEQPQVSVDVTAS